MKEQKNNGNTVKIPVINIKMMSDEEWNKLAYQNYLERKNDISRLKG